MKVIDFARKGNVVRFYLGADELKSWGGDDWNDAPYEHNAGTVYDEYVEAVVDCAVPYDALVLEPANEYGVSNSPWCKDDMQAGKVPCLLVVPEEVCRDSEYGSWYDGFNQWLGHKGVVKIYVGQDWNEVAPHFIVLK